MLVAVLEAKAILWGIINAFHLAWVVSVWPLVLILICILVFKYLECSVIYAAVLKQPNDVPAHWSCAYLSPSRDDYIADLCRQKAYIIAC